MAKRRVFWQFGVLTASVAAATVFIVSVKGFAPMVLFPAATTLVMTVGAVRAMKLANRKAQRRIAAGESRAFEALGTERARNSDPELTLGGSVR